MYPVCLICLDRFWERFRRMMHMSPALSYGRPPLMALPDALHDALRTNRSTALLAPDDMTTEEAILLPVTAMDTVF